MFLLVVLSLLCNKISNFTLSFHVKVYFSFKLLYGLGGAINKPTSFKVNTADYWYGPMFIIKC